MCPSNGCLAAWVVAVTCERLSSNVLYAGCKRGSNGGGIHTGIRPLDNDYGSTVYGGLVRPSRDTLLPLIGHNTWRPSRLEVHLQERTTEWMSSSDSQDSDRPGSLGRIRDERTQRQLRRETVRRACVTLARTRSLRRVAERITEDPSCSGAQQTAGEVLRHSPEEADNISQEGFPEWKALTLSEGDKESHWTTF